MTQPLCIYHGNCADGFGAAWVFSRYGGKPFDLLPGIYQNDPPDVTDREVYLVDFSYRRSVVERMREQAKRIVLIDHHKTAIEDLKPLIDSGAIEALVNLEKSGATLAWEWFLGKDQRPPPLLLHIEDRDLWRFRLDGTREIQANVFSHPYDLEVWDELMFCDPAELIAEGRAIERKHHKDVAELVAAFRRELCIGGHWVPAANLPYTLTSDAGHLMCQPYASMSMHGEIVTPPFAACYWDTPEGRVFSLRSTETGLDVSEIARAYGGGGHRNAAGFRVTFDEAREFEGIGLRSV